MKGKNELTTVVSSFCIVGVSWGPRYGKEECNFNFGTLKVVVFG